MRSMSAGLSLLLGLALAAPPAVAASTATASEARQGTPRPPLEAEAARPSASPADGSATGAASPDASSSPITSAPADAPRGTEASAAAEPRGRDRRVLGELGESCRAALDCRPELRCKTNVCVRRPTPKDELEEAPAARGPAEVPAAQVQTRDRIRLGVELRGGAGWLRRDEEDLLGRRDPEVTDAATFAGAATGVLELGLDDDQLTLGLGVGLGLPAGLERPALQTDLRAGWRLWRGSPSVGLDLEPRIEGFFGGLPGDLGLGGALALRFRMHFLDVGLLGGGMVSGEGTGRVGINGFRERLVVVHGGAYLALMPELLSW